MPRTLAAAVPPDYDGNNVTTYLSKRVAFSLLAAAAAVACSQIPAVTYLATVIVEHERIMIARRPIRALIASRHTLPELRRKLEYVLRARRFASVALGLPDNRSYTTYVELRRPRVGWSVNAAPELSTSPVTWCFPVAGCVAYRSFPSRAAADAFAARLRHAGNDVYVSGVTAYSTLGWFDDPVLSSYIDLPPPQLAGLIFHELAHQELYVPGDSAFNEGFATAVEREGVHRWLAAHGPPGELEREEESERRQDLEVATLLAARDELAAVYRTPAPTDRKREQKAGILRRTQNLLCGLQQSCEHVPLPRSAATRLSDLNNAYLVAVSTYFSYVPAFRELLGRSQSNLPKFFDAARRVGNMPPDRRREFLRQLTQHTLTEP